MEGAEYRPIVQRYADAAVAMGTLSGRTFTDGDITPLSDASAENLAVQHKIDRYIGT
jgi:hypothetical protein